MRELKLGNIEIAIDERYTDRLYCEVFVSGNDYIEDRYNYLTPEEVAILKEWL